MASIPEDQSGEPRYQEFEDPETGDDYAIRRVGPLPRLAGELLVKLHETGLHTKYRSKDDDIRRVRLKESGQTFWLEFGRYRDYWAVPSVEGMVEVSSKILLSSPP